MVTLRDVARAAGVSPATASRALAAPDMVAADRRSRVLRAARDLGYRPNRAARELSTGRTGMLCLVVPDLANPFFAAVAKAVHARARASGYAVLVGDSDEDLRTEAELVTQLAERGDGLILCSPRMSDADLRALDARAPVVLVNREADGLPAVVIDNADGTRQAVSHLHALGHRRIAYAGGPADSWSDVRRRNGLREAVAALGNVEVVDLGPFSRAFTGGTAAGDLVAASGATAVLAHNDLVALGILDRLQARGVHVPQDVSVVGYDDIPSATLVSPALTTVAVPLDRLGRAAVDLLLAQTAPGDSTDPGGGRAEAPGGAPVRVPVSLVVRASTDVAPAPRSAPTQTGPARTAR